MGSPKALLEDADGHPFIVRIIKTFVEAGVSRTVVVTGEHHDAIVAATDRARFPVAPTIVRNPNPDRGQLSSLWCGMDEVCGSSTPAFVMTLVDVPGVRASTVRAVIDAWSRSHAPIVRPAFNARRGHPVIFDRAVFDELRHAPLDGGARTVVRAHAHEGVDVPVDDPGCIADIDTPSDYETFRREPA
jgi:molybdenum cofactor cytidylyltransferase